MSTSSETTKTTTTTTKNGTGGSTIVDTLQNLAGPAFSIISVVVPAVIIFISNAYTQFQKLPKNVLDTIYGFVICFFGGTFPTLFAAIQAAKHGGRQTFINAISDLSNEIVIVMNESKKDDAKDADGDGVKDVKSIPPKELMQRKFKLVLRKMNPEKVDNALGALYGVWLSVAAVLSIQFARTISLSLTIADSLEKPMNRWVAPIFKAIIPNEYSKWIPVVLGWFVKWIAMSFAWYVQSVVSAAASALNGGLMMSHGMYMFCISHKVTLFGLLPDDHTNTYIDELFSYVFAAMGFYTQFKSGFTLPFPLNLILWPFQFAEYYIRWTITSKAT